MARVRKPKFDEQFEGAFSEVPDRAALDERLDEAAGKTPTLRKPDPQPEDEVAKSIVSRDGQFCVTSADGSRNFGCYDTRAAAERRLAQVEHFGKGDEVTKAAELLAKCGLIHVRVSPEGTELFFDQGEAPAPAAEPVPIPATDQWGMPRSQSTIGPLDMPTLYPAGTVRPAVNKSDESED